MDLNRGPSDYQLPLMLQIYSNIVQRLSLLEKNKVLSWFSHVDSPVQSTDKCNY